MGLFESGKKQAYLITNAYYRRYFSSLSVSEGYLLLTEEKFFYFTDARYYSAFSKKCTGKIVSKLFSSLGDIKDCLTEQNIKVLYIDFDSTTLTEFEKYKSFDIEIKNGSENLKVARSVKSQDEIDCIKKSCEILEKSFYEVLPYIKVGITEKEIAELLKKQYISNGAEDLSFDSIVAFNENSAVPHHETSDKILTNNSVVLIDTGCKYNGYCSDYTRTLYVGEPPKKFKEVYNLVWGANELSEKLIKSGMDTVDADKIAREYLEKNGYGKFFTHSLGHGVGLEIHESPTLSPKKSTVLEDGMVFTIEPGVYLDGEFGIRIEDTVMLQNGKVEKFFTDSKDLIILK